MGVVCTGVGREASGSTPRPIVSMSSRPLFLGGLVSTRARLRFTGRGEVYNEGRSPAKLFSANGETLLSGLSHYRGLECTPEMRQ